jgi:hypothetical protein
MRNMSISWFVKAINPHSCLPWHGHAWCSAAHCFAGWAGKEQVFVILKGQWFECLWRVERMDHDKFLPQNHGLQCIHDDDVWPASGCFIEIIWGSFITWTWRNDGHARILSFQSEHWRPEQAHNMHWRWGTRRCVLCSWWENWQHGHALRRAWHLCVFPSQNFRIRIYSARPSLSTDLFFSSKKTSQTLQRFVFKSGQEITVIKCWTLGHSYRQACLCILVKKKLVVFPQFPVHFIRYWWDATKLTATKPVLLIDKLFWSQMFAIDCTRSS